MEHKKTSTTHQSKATDGTLQETKSMFDESYKSNMQVFKRNCFPKNTERIQKNYLQSHIKKSQKLSFMNTSQHIKDIKGMIGCVG
eukprot:5614865-Ditylum_brightwellii.AAC.1